MARIGRPPVLDKTKRREILAILTVGCSRRTAARYVGCAPATIQNTAERDAEFAAQLGRAENQAEIAYLKNIRKAASKEQYWRAAAWALERHNPEEYAPRRPNMVSLDEVERLLSRFAGLVVAEVPVERFCKSVLKQMHRLLTALDPSLPHKEPSRDD